MGTTVLGIVIIAVVAVMIVYRMRRGLSRRSQAMRVLHGPLAGGDMEAREPGSAADISDGAQVPARELWGALRVARVPELDAEGEPNDLAGLGLKLHEGDRDTPQIMEGKRNGHQVFIRQGNVGDTISPGAGFRKLRVVTVVRVEAPAFELEARDGALVPKGEVPAGATAVLSELTSSPDVWHDLRVVSGPIGIAASRAYGDDYLGAWIYDLWLLERLGDKLGAKALPDERLTRSWAPPYGLRDWAPSALDTLRGE